MAEARYTKRGKVAKWRREQGLFVPFKVGDTAFLPCLKSKEAAQGRVVCPQGMLTDKAVYWLQVEILDTPEESPRQFAKVLVQAPKSDAQHGESINLDQAWLFSADEKSAVAKLVVEKAKADKAKAAAADKATADTT